MCEELLLCAAAHGVLKECMWVTELKCDLILSPLENHPLHQFSFLLHFILHRYGWKSENSE
jgi:hypothetical protein